MNDIQFPNIGITLSDLGDGITIFGFEIKFYGMVIALGFLLGYLFINSEAKRTKQNPEDYLDYFLLLIIPAIVGARLYFVLFSYKDYFVKGQGFWNTVKAIVNTRNGGLAIYGGIIAGAITLIIFCKKKKKNLWQMTDTCVMGLLVGQILGRWGNFFNREAFGEYTNSLFAMAIPVDYYNNKGSLGYLINSGIISDKMIDNVKVVDGMEWIQVHPTFLYESVWNLMVLLIIFLYRRNKKFEGELTLLYFWGYGLGRVWIEGLRTDSLMISGINMRASQLLAAVCVLVSAGLFIYKHIKLKKSCGNDISKGMA